MVNVGVSVVVRVAARAVLRRLTALPVPAGFTVGVVAVEGVQVVVGGVRMVAFAQAVQVYRLGRWSARDRLLEDGWAVAALAVAARSAVVVIARGATHDIVMRVAAFVQGASVAASAITLLRVALTAAERQVAPVALAQAALGASMAA